MVKSSNLKKHYNNCLNHYKYKTEEIVTKKNAKKHLKRMHRKRHKLSFFIQSLLNFNGRNNGSDTCSADTLSNDLSPCSDHIPKRCTNCALGCEEVGKLEDNLIPIIKLEEHQKAKVRFIKGDYKVIRRLLDMGITTDATISLIKSAPLNGPVEIAVRGSKLALGREIASNIFVELSDQKMKVKN